MPDSALAQLAESVKEKLNNEEIEWSQTFTASRVYDLTAELQDNGLHVDVAIREYAGDIDSRESGEEECSIDVAVRKKCDVSNVSLLDELMYFLEEIKDYFLAKRLSTESAGDAWCNGWAQVPAYYPNHLQMFRQFTGVITLKFVLDRNLS